MSRSLNARALWPGICDYVRSAYIQCRRESGQAHYLPGPRWDGGRSKFGKQYKPIWPKLAEMFVTRGISPPAFMRMAFLTSGADAVLPTHLLSERLIERYLHDRATMEQGDATQELATQQLACRSEIRRWQACTDWPKETVWRHVLKDKQAELSALFRYCLASSEQMHDVADAYLAAAVFQYFERAEAYDKEWREFLPPSFAATVAQFRQELHGASKFNG